MENNFEQPKPELEQTSFHKKEFTPDGGVVYVFDHVAVKIDNSGKNYKELPELMFGTFEIVSTIGRHYSCAEWFWLYF